MTQLEPDREQMERFVSDLFRHALDGDGFVTVRSFYDNEGEAKPFRIQGVPVSAGLGFLIDVAEDIARRSANEPKRVVFCPPLGLFNNGERAREEDLVAGIALSVELDAHPSEARETLEGLLGPATVVVQSGGMWSNGNGAVEPKLHLHWRLRRPAQGPQLATLKRARELATRIVGGDASNIPTVHPIRWPGSWHRKREPVLCVILDEDPDAEIDLDRAIEMLTDAAPKGDDPGQPGNPPDDRADWDVLIGNVLDGSALHDSLRDLAASCVAKGMRDGDTVDLLRSLMRKSRAPRDDRWLARYNEIPRAVRSGREKFGAAAETAAQAVRPVDLWGAFTPPPLPHGLLPKAIEDFAVQQGELMGADPAGLAMAALTVCGAAIKDGIQLQVKTYDRGWMESARIWTALIGDPSTKKTPIMRTAARPLVKIDDELWSKYTDALARYNDLDKEEKKGAEPPPQVRARLEDTTIEAAQEVLKDTPGGVLLLQDELSGWFGSMDKYSGHRGAAKDRGFWLQAWNGGSYAFNRVSRGAGMVGNLSVSLLGGIQPDLIRKLAADTHDDGLLQRLFPIVLGPATVGIDAPVAVEIGAYNTLVEKLYALTPGSISFWGAGANFHNHLEFDAAAQAVRRELERKHLDLMTLEVLNKKLAAHIGKLDGLFARLCIIWHCVENCDADIPRHITAATARRVAGFLHQFLLPHTLAFYSGVLALAEDHNRLAAVAGFILAHKLTRVTNRDIARGDRTMRGLARHETEQIFEQLEALGWLSRTPGPRPSDAPHWLVNEHCHQLFAERAKMEAERRLELRAVIQEYVNAQAAR